MECPVLQGCGRQGAAVLATPARGPDCPQALEMAPSEQGWVVGPGPGVTCNLVLLVISGSQQDTGLTVWIQQPPDPKRGPELTIGGRCVGY